jgi:DNA replication and repair protein RecF
MINRLTLQDFRNYENKTFEFSEKNVVFFGRNGRGKTNILEAISILSVGKSWRETKPSDLIRNGVESALITAETNTEDLYKIIVQKRSRSFEKNEKKIPLSRHFGTVATLLFVPEYLHLFAGTRTNRLRFFDRFLFQISPELRSLLSKFNRALKQKNALLKNFDLSLFSKQKLQSQLNPWNEILAETIPQIFEIRQNFLQTLNPILQTELENLSQSPDEIQIDLVSKERYEQTRNGVLNFFEAHRQREISAKKCIIGAHLDDFQFTFRGQPIVSTASRGEERSVLLSLLSAQKQILKHTLGSHPILLLDDVFSELDQSRQDYLENLCSESQIFFTTTHQDHFQNFHHPVQKFEIQ